MKRIFIFTVFLLCSVAIWAQSFSVDGINYNITSTDNLTVEVTSGGEYSGDIAIPDKVECEGNDYSVTSIGYSAFDGCSGLTSVTIPNSVTSIDWYAFRGCSGLTSVVSEIENSFEISINVFSSETYAKAVLTVPTGKKSAYEATSGWNKFKKLVEKGIIYFDDVNVKALCMANWDTNNDGELSIDEAAAVTDIGTVFNDNDVITTFNELSYFTGLTSIGDGAFYRSSLTSVTIPNSVTSIGYSAFWACRGLTSVTIPNSVTSIGDEAFQYCSGLTSVTIPNSVTSIGDGAFQYCSSLTSVTIPNSVTSIGSNAFDRTAWYNNQPDGLVYAGNVAYKYKGTMPENTIIDIKGGTLSISGFAFDGCTGLTSVTIPNSVTSIGDGAFIYCSGLTSVTIPNSVTSIGDGAFGGCSGLTSVTIPNSVTSISDDTFSGCTGLTSVTIPNSVTSIGSYAFYGCSGLTSVTIPNSVTSIGGFAFDGCRGLTSVTIPNSVTSIGDWPFNGCSGLTSVTIPNNVEIIEGLGLQDCGNLKNVIVPVADYSAFCSNQIVEWIYINLSKPVILIDEMGNEIKEFVIPEDVTSVSDFAFYRCTGLTSVTIGKNVTSIGDGAFFGCSGLTSINVESGNSVYDSREDCNAVIETSTNTLVFGCMNTTIPNSVTSIGESAFLGCSGLTSVTIPNSVTSIGESAFLGCSGLTSVTIPNSVTSIGDDAFYGCSGLTSVTIPNSVTSIGEMAFQYCSGLSSLTIPNSVTSIGLQTFLGCSGLTSVIIPNSVTSIGSSAFKDCTSLTSVTIPNSVTYIRSAFLNCSSLTSIVVERGNAVYDSRNNCNAIIETTTNKLIAGCKNTIIPNSVTSIGVWAFSGSGLTSITIPNSVTSIGECAFYGCSGLKNVISEIKSPFEIKNNVFKGSYSIATLTVPHGTMSAYKATSGWNLFENIEEAMGLDPTEGDGGTDYGDDSEINNDTNLDGNVVGNIYYNIGNEDGGYSSAEGCIVINTPSADDNIDGKDIFGEDFKDHFTGIVFKIGEGSGTIKVKAETIGSMVLKVKIGENAPVVMVLNGKLEASFPYSVSEPTNVYIYGGESASGAPMHRASGDNALKIYGISWQETGTSVEGLTPDPSPTGEGSYYTLDGQKLNGKPTQKGVYIQNGKKIIVK